MTTARLETIELPDFGMPGGDADAATGAVRVAPGARPGRGCRRAGYDALVVYADREHFANLSHLTGFDPRFEEAILLAAVAMASRYCWPATSASAWRRRRRCRCASSCGRTSACPASRATARDHCPTSWPRRASRPAPAWAWRAGSPTPTGAGWRCPAFLADALRAAVGAERPRGERQRPLRRRRRPACEPSTRSSSWLPSSTPPATPRRESSACSSACGRA